MYKYKNNRFTVSPGIRFESIKLSRDDFGESNPKRDFSNLSSIENKVSVFIPGIGLNYTLSNKLSIFSGIHKGYSPPGSSEGQKAEESINFELGTRFSVNNFNGEVIFYYNNYSNLLGIDDGWRISNSRTTEKRIQLCNKKKNAWPYFKKNDSKIIGNW